MPGQRAMRRPGRAQPDGRRFTARVAEPNPRRPLGASTGSLEPMTTNSPPSPFALARRALLLAVVLGGVVACNKSSEAAAAGSSQAPASAAPVTLLNVS